MSEDDLIVKKPPPVMKSDEELRPTTKGDADRARRNRWREQGRLRPTYYRILVMIVFALSGAAATAYFNRNFSDDLAFYLRGKVTLVEKWWMGER